MRRLVVTWLGLAALVAAGACRGDSRPDAGEPPVGAATATATAPATPTLASFADSSVAPAALAACELGDSLLRRVPGTVLRRMPATPFDSLWPDSTGRRACRLFIAGQLPGSYAPVDSLMTWLRLAGWSDRTVLSADGPDGTVQGIHRSDVTCLVEGRWDGGDDTDTTYVPSDTIEVHLACTRSVPTDTIIPGPG